MRRPPISPPSRTLRACSKCSIRLADLSIPKMADVRLSHSAWGGRFFGRVTGTLESRLPLALAYGPDLTFSAGYLTDCNRLGLSIAANSPSADVGLA